MHQRRKKLHQCHNLDLAVIDIKISKTKIDRWVCKRSILKSYILYLITWSVILASCFPFTPKGLFAAIAGAFAFSTITLLLTSLFTPQPNRFNLNNGL